MNLCMLVYVWGAVCVCEEGVGGGRGVTAARWVMHYQLRDLPPLSNMASSVDLWKTCVDHRLSYLRSVILIAFNVTWPYWVSRKFAIVIASLSLQTTKNCFFFLSCQHNSGLCILLMAGWAGLCLTIRDPVFSCNLVLFPWNCLLPRFFIMFLKYLILSFLSHSLAIQIVCAAVDLLRRDDSILQKWAQNMYLGNS